jgi:hypothetical protein
LKKKLLITFGLAGIIAASVAVGAYAASDIKLFINGKLINTDLQIVDGSSYVPLRVVSDSLGAEVKWDEATRSITIVQPGVPQVTNAVGNSPEDIAIEYVNLFLNGSDKDAKTKFWTDKIVSDTQPLYQLALNFSDGSNVFRDPKVVEKTAFDEQGKKGDLVLVQGTDDAGAKKETVIMTMDGKFVVALFPNSKDADTKKKYDDIRARFKTELLK